jgi:hypothetical protein
MKTYELVDSPIDPILKVTEGEKIWWVEIGSTSKRYAEYLALQDWLAEGKKEADFWTSRNGL